MKNSILDNFPPCPPAQAPPEKCNFIFIVVSLSLRKVPEGNYNNRECKMHTNFFCTNCLNTPRGPGHPCKIPGTSQIPLFKLQGRQTSEGGRELCDPHPFGWKTPSPPGALRTQKELIFVLLFRRRTNVQQLTCKIDLPFSFYYLFFSFVLLELKPFVLKGKVLGEKL